MATFQLGHPIARVVEMETHDPSFVVVQVSTSFISPRSCAFVYALIARL
jgi:hypothetical protein